MSLDRIMQAHTVMGVRPGASLTRLRWRYRAIARKWHPDPVERANRMQAVDAAYRALLNYYVLHDAQPPLPGTVPAASVKDRLSRDEIESVRATLEAGAPMDDVLASLDPPVIIDFILRELPGLGWIIALYMGLLITGVAILVWLGASTTLIIVFCFFAYGVFHFLFWRRRAMKAQADPPLPTPWR